MSWAALDGYQIAIDAIGDAANAQALDADSELQSTYKGDRRWRIEHAQIVDPADIPRLAQLARIASMQPVHQTSDRTMAEARLGPARLKGAYALKSLLTSGARLAFGSDTPVESPDPFAGLAAAITREYAKGEPFGGWQPQDGISREEALAGFHHRCGRARRIRGKQARSAGTRLRAISLGDRDPMLATPPNSARQKCWKPGWPDGNSFAAESTSAVSVPVVSTCGSSTGSAMPFAYQT